MSRYSASACLPFTCDQLFDIAADIEAYPEFLPGWSRVQVLERTDNRLSVEQSLRVGILPFDFRSLAVLERPHCVHVTSEDCPFHSLIVKWRFVPEQDGHCHVSLDIELIMKNPGLNKMAGLGLGVSTEEVMSRFSQRAREVYSSQ